MEGGLSKLHGKWFLSLLLFLVVVATYANSLSSGFVWDDHPLIVRKQEFFSHPRNALALLDSPDAALSARHAPPYYRPLGALSYMVDHYVWGLDPFWYHLENLLLHALVVVLFYLLLAEVFKDKRLAFFAALLFAVYPVNAEAVDAAFNRNVLLCAVFSLASLLFLTKGGGKWAAMSLMSYFLALLSKEPAVVLPFFLLSLELTGGLSAGQRQYKIKKSVLTGFFGITAVYFIIRRLVLGAFIAKRGLGSLFSTARLKLVLAVCFEHFKLFIFPFMLNALYTQQAVSFSPFKAAAAISCILLLFYLSLSRKTPSPVRTGAQWIFWGLLPVSNIVRIPSAPVAERFQYTVLPGFVLILSYLLARLQKKYVLPGTAVSLALVLILGVRTFERNFIWHDNIALFSSMIRSDPSDATAYYNLGNVYGERGDLKNAELEFRAALAKDPGYVNARLNLGVAYAKEGRLPIAVRQFMRAVALDPSMPEAHLYLGTGYEKEGLLKLAKSQFQTVLELDPGNAFANHDLHNMRARVKN